MVEVLGMIKAIKKWFKPRPYYAIKEMVDGSYRINTRSVPSFTREFDTLKEARAYIDSQTVKRIVE